MRVFVETIKNGKHGLKQLPDLPLSRAYLVLALDAGLVDKISRLDGMGHFEGELTELLEREIEHFFRTRPIEIATPGRSIKPADGISLYDPRDPLKERIN